MGREEALGLAHILLVILVFALEIPVLIVEAAADDRIRHLLHKRFNHSATTILMTATLAMVVGLVFATTEAGGMLIRESHPGTPTEGEPPRELIITAPEAPAPGGRSSAAQRNAPRLVAIAGTFQYGSMALILLFGISWWWSMKTDVRGQLVRHIQRQLLRSFRQRKSFSEADVEDLIIIGEAGPPGREKHAVLVAIQEVCATACTDSYYGGSELGPLMVGLEQILSDGTRKGTKENFLSAIEVLRRTGTVITARQMDAKSDAIALGRVGARLGELGLSVSPDTIALQCLAAVPGRPEVPFRIGRAALQEGHYRVAIAALNRLESLAIARDRVSLELVALVALFAECDGSSLEVARSFPKRLGRSVASIADSARIAELEFIERGDLGSAAAVRRYMDSVLMGRQPPERNIDDNTNPRVSTKQGRVFPRGVGLIIATGLYFAAVAVGRRTLN